MLSQPPAIHNRTNVEIVLYRTTLPIRGCRGPLWPTLPLNITIIILNTSVIIESSLWSTLPLSITIYSGQFFRCPFYQNNLKQSF